MQTIIDNIRQLFTTHSQEPVTDLEKLPQSGSNRMYFRIRTADRSYIATYNDNMRENRTFIEFSRHFRQQGCPVPEIYWVNEAYTVYLQEDFGDISLLNELERQGHNDQLYALFRQSLEGAGQAADPGRRRPGL
jgi:aminoglycoside/choline kinase family phosphotransferase